MSVPSWAVPGAKVACIKRTPWVILRHGVGDDRYPAFGEVCTIKAVSIEVGRPTLEVFEYANLLEARFFRPLVSQQDDLEAHFYQYLKTGRGATKRERERA